MLNTTQGLFIIPHNIKEASGLSFLGYKLKTNHSINYECFMCFTSVHKKCNLVPIGAFLKLVIATYKKHLGKPKTFLKIKSQGIKRAIR